MYSKSLWIYITLMFQEADMIKHEPYYELITAI